MGSTVADTDGVKRNCVSNRDDIGYRERVVLQLSRSSNFEHDGTPLTLCPLSDVKYNSRGIFLNRELKKKKE